jgi:hypothetical protein
MEVPGYARLSQQNQAMMGMLRWILDNRAELRAKGHTLPESWPEGTAVEAADWHDNAERADRRRVPDPNQPGGP